MEIAIRNIGNSKGLVLPKPLLAQVGLDGASTAEVVLKGDSIILRKPAKTARAGWAQAAAALASQGGDSLLMGEFGNTDDEELSW
jgi:antitoxin MazE